MHHGAAILPGETELTAALSRLARSVSKHHHLNVTMPEISLDKDHRLQRANVLIKLGGPDAGIEADALEAVLGPDNDTFGFKPHRMGAAGVEIRYSLPLDQMSEVASKLTAAINDVGDNTFGRRIRAMKEALGAAASKQ